jgi:hypothetical protein
MIDSTHRMRQRTRILLMIIVPALLVASCAAPYQARGWGAGYEETKIDGNTFKVTYVDDDPNNVDTYDLYRCAELTLEQGYDYFIITEHDGNVATNVHQAVVSGAPSTRSSTYTEWRVIKMFKGSKPQENVNAYDAHEVVANMGPNIKR